MRVVCELADPAIGDIAGTYELNQALQFLGNTLRSISAPKTKMARPKAPTTMRLV
jgi:hypothetical protein